MEEKIDRGIEKGRMKRGRKERLIAREDGELKVGEMEWEKDWGMEG